MNIVQELIADGRTKDAITILLAYCPDYTNEIAQQSSRLEQSAKILRTGGQYPSDHQMTVNQVNAALLEIANYNSVKGLLPSSESSTPNKEIKPAIMKNKVTLVREIFEAIERDIDDMNYSKVRTLGHIADLNAIFESKVFSAFSDPIYRSDWDELNSAEQTQRIREVLTSMVSKKERIMENVRAFQEKIITRVSLDERIQNFFNTPTLKAWNELSTGLEERFADATLFGPGVLDAFRGWSEKITGDGDELMFAMEFNLSHRFDFGSFLHQNFKIKNFNY